MSRVLGGILAGFAEDPEGMDAAALALFQQAVHAQQHKDPPPKPGKAKKPQSDLNLLATASLAEAGQDADGADMGATYQVYCEANQLDPRDQQSYARFMGAFGSDAMANDTFAQASLHCFQKLFTGSTVRDFREAVPAMAAHFKDAGE